MDKDLVSIYESNYLQNPNVIEEKKKFVAKDNDDDDTPKKSPKFKKKGKKKKSMSKAEIGGITYDSFNRSETIFDKILREMNEMGGGPGVGSVGGDDDNVFDTEDYVGGDEEEQTFTLSELRGMTLGELVGLLGGEDAGEEEFGGEEDFTADDFSEEDEVPTESTCHTGATGNYDGKAKRQAPTSHVKGNGDADFGKAETDYDPEEVDGNEESNYKGDQGTYDGKAKRQAPTSHVKGNGDADFGKAKPGYRTSAGKKEKNYF